MPHVMKDERYVEVGYELNCGYERAEALAQDLKKELINEPGLHSAKDDTRGWDGDRKSVVVVNYLTLKDANRLDQKVRQLLSRKANFTYDPNFGSAYGRRGSYLTCNPKTTLECVQT